MVGLLVGVPLLAKGKDKTLPPYILQAHTVAVMVYPGAGIDAEDPRANEVAQKDVETALANWGRFQPLIGTREADLIIVIRKGHRKIVDSTISDPRQNNRVGVINPTNNGIDAGIQTPRPQSSGGGANGAGQQLPQDQTAHPQLEVGVTDDSMMVFDGKVSKPLDSPPGWRYTAQDGLRPHNVPAVEEFRKAVAEAEKAAAAKKP
jgi:hypothetical protein